MTPVNVSSFNDVAYEHASQHNPRPREEAPYHTVRLSLVVEEGWRPVQIRHLAPNAPHQGKVHWQEHFQVRLSQARLSQGDRPHVYQYSQAPRLLAAKRPLLPSH
ncbi:unnamed protein product [Peronospora belbahrii]|uniref:Uncharacterized protein n=1 Tax=Peronospora belbahrii TaxID=622444 RepID=A0AAU9L2H5_9STRA|nr:unnamed protein product [Peronospora belbahrii]CAH0515609.1 unnamed protein product [Peronospora belbahrii]